MASQSMSGASAQAAREGGSGGEGEGEGEGEEGYPPPGLTLRQQAARHPRLRNRAWGQGRRAHRQTLQPRPRR